MKSILSFLAGAVGFILSQSAGVVNVLPHGVAAVLAVVSAGLAALGIRSSGNVPPTINALLDSLGKGWKTVTGVIVAIVGVLLSPDLANIIPANVAHIVAEFGAVLAALGLYHAQTFASSSKS